MPTEDTTRIEKSLQRELADSIIKHANLDDLRILVATGAKINDEVTQGLRPIHYATYERYREAVQFLLVRGCDINACDDNGYSAIHLAAEYGYLEMMTLLLNSGCKVNFRQNDKDMFPRTTICDEPLRLAIKNNHYDAAKMLLEHGANPNSPRYFFGSELNHLSVMETEYADLLLSYGAYPDEPDRNGLTMLMKSCRVSDALPTVLCLLCHGANVNAMADERHDYRTVLHYAVLSGNCETVKVLLQNGALLNRQDYQKPTALHLAILKGDPKLVQLLVDAGADTNASSPVIGSPLHVCCADNILNRLAILQILLENGADLNRNIICEDGPLKSILGEYLSSNEIVDRDVIRLFLQYGCSVVFKSQFRSPAGILNYLHNIVGHEDPTVRNIVRDLMEEADSFDPVMIRRSATLSDKEKTLALQYARNPKSLKRNARNFFRKFFGWKLPHLIHQLGLPRTLQSYLRFDSF